MRLICHICRARPRIMQPLGTLTTLPKWLIRYNRVNTTFFRGDITSRSQVKDKHLQRQCRTFTISKTKILAETLSMRKRLITGKELMVLETI